MNFVVFIFVLFGALTAFAQGIGTGVKAEIVFDQCKLDKRQLDSYEDEFLELSSIINEKYPNMGFVEVIQDINMQISRLKILNNLNKKLKDLVIQIEDISDGEELIAQPTRECDCQKDLENYKRMITILQNYGMTLTRYQTKCIKDATMSDAINYLYFETTLALDQITKLKEKKQEKLDKKNKRTKDGE